MLLTAASFYGKRFSVETFYQAERVRSVGPLLHALADLGHAVLHRPDEFENSAVLREPGPEIISIEEYLSGLSLPDGLPNVIVVLVESLRADQLTAYGSPRAVMPTVERLASEGLASNHYTQASHSDYADPTVFSSHYPLRSRSYSAYPSEIPYPRVMVYDILKACGYDVGVFSSQNEHWGGMINYLNTGSIDRFLHSETYDGPTYVPRGDSGFETFLRGSRRSGRSMIASRSGKPSNGSHRWPRPIFHLHEPPEQSYSLRSASRLC